MFLSKIIVFLLFLFITFAGNVMHILHLLYKLKQKAYKIIILINNILIFSPGLIPNIRDFKALMFCNSIIYTGTS